MEKSVTGNHILTSISNPCLSTTNDGPTQILPFLYLGSQQDAMDSRLLSVIFVIYHYLSFIIPFFLFGLPNISLHILIIAEIRHQICDKS